MENIENHMVLNSSDAPWNQSDIEPIEVKCTYIETLSKEVTLNITDYTTSGPESEVDEEGVVVHYPPTIEQVNVRMSDYTDNHLTVENIIKEAVLVFDNLSEEYLDKYYLEKDTALANSYYALHRKYSYYAEEAKNWCTNDSVILND